MTTATKTKPASRPPEPEPQPDPGQQWKDGLLRTMRALTHLDTTLVVAPYNTPLLDLVEVRKLLDPYVLEAGAILALAIRVASPSHPTQNPMLEGVYQLALRVSSETRKDQIADVLTEVLTTVNEGIARCLSQPNPDRTVVYPSSDFPKEALRTQYFDFVPPTGCWMFLGLVDQLPPDHPLAKLEPFAYHELIENGTRRRAALLGRAQPGVLGGTGQFSNPGLPRAFYYVSDSLTWTAVSRRIQLTASLERRLNPDDYRAAHDALQRMENPTKLPKPWSPGPPPPPDVWPSWTVQTLFILDCLLHTPERLKPPPPSTSLENLLAVRSAFAVDDARPNPIAAAVYEYSQGQTGDRRRQTLYTQLPPIYRACDAAITRELEACLLWASSQRPR